MRNKINKHRAVLHCINAFVCLVYLVGILAFYMITDSLDEIDYSTSMLGIVAISFIVLNMIPDEESAEN